MARGDDETSAFLCDANVLVRLLINDPPHQARAAARALRRARNLAIPVLVPLVVVAEIVYVLNGVYGVTRAETAAQMLRLMALRSLTFDEDRDVRAAFDLWRESRIDFVDAYLAARAIGSGPAGVLSFDRDYDRLPGAVRVDPARFASTSQE